MDPEVTSKPEYVATPEPDVPVPMPSRGGTPYCPACGYSCGCCCHDSCQTPCPSLDEDGYCNCTSPCHGGHEPWDCHEFVVRYHWARTKSERLEVGNTRAKADEDRSAGRWCEVCQQHGGHHTDRHPATD